MIDAHQHFWTLARGDYGWLSPDESVLYRDFAPDDLAPLIERAGITRTVVVQAAPTLDETRYLLGVAEGSSFVAGVVGWVDLAGAEVEASLDLLASHALFRGVRPMVQDIADDDWMLGRALTPGLKALGERNLSFDALVLPRHLPRLHRLMERHPDLRVVIDHAAKPEIAAGHFDAWAEEIARLARETPVLCKLSGLVTEAARAWQASDLRPYVAHLLECFGTDRLLWGSDWPVVELAGGFARWRETSLLLLEELGDTERAAILGGNAARFYRLDPC
ncbi:MAG: amidohydrolase family protein [Deltaproteobacteria bacterium]|nr:amidohydrolase family protein [Deltaproteobacteria bacterium]MBW2385810.1 amidohydrolase family protein [Deltaproteobacteria bacterium]